MPDVTIYHNPRCSKSRTALQVLRDAGVEPRVVEYLKEPLSRKALQELCGRIGIQPQELLRRGEGAFKDRFAGKEPSAAAALAAMAEEPILMERPVVVGPKGAVVARPPELAAKVL